MMMNKCQSLVVFMAAVAGVYAATVQGVEPLRPETVTTRERPELDPLGMRAGTFFAYPAMTLEGEYDDNIYAVDSNEESDFITHIRPELAVESDWGRHALNFNADADIGRYNDNGDEDYEDYRVGVDGRLDIQQHNSLAGRAGYAEEHEERSSPDDRARTGEEPTTYDIGSLAAFYRHRFNRVGLRVGAALDQYDYDNVTALDGITTIDNQDRDRDEVTYLAQVNYELVPDYSAFLRTRFRDVEYDQKVDNDGLRRSSDGYQVDVGTELFLSGVMFGEVFIGYVDRGYDDSSLNDIDEFTAGASVTWLPTGLTTVTFAVERDIAETIVENTAGILETSGSVEVDHELLRNLLLNARLAARDDDFKGTSRNDDYLRFGLGAKYLMNRNLYLTMGYDYLDRDSNAAGEDFTDNRFLVGIRGQL